MYSHLYAFLHVLFCLPHISLITFITIINIDLNITWKHIAFAYFIMFRVPCVGIAMSACLHRYFAHNAFKTTRTFEIVIALLSCCTYQGGCLWWASKHRKHHTFCDQEKDPHSATRKGTIYAWLLWQYFECYIDWDFVPTNFVTYLYDILRIYK